MSSDPQSKTGANIIDSNNNPNSQQTQTQYYYTHPQDRGNPFLGWIPWTLHLSYDRMLRGIPGTGTRNKGMEGSFLGVNLDAIILFRYNGTLNVELLLLFMCQISQKLSGMCQKLNDGCVGFFAYALL